MAKLRVAIVPGNGDDDSYQGNWCGCRADVSRFDHLSPSFRYPWLADELRRADIDVALKQMPDPRKYLRPALRGPLSEQSSLITASQL